MRPYLVPLMCVQNVSGPPQGHWNRVHAGRAVSKSPAAPARGPGKRPYTHVDPRLARLPKAPLPSSAGPFASAKVAEELEELRAQTLKAIGRPASAARITLPHPAIRMLLAQNGKTASQGG